MVLVCVLMCGRNLVNMVGFCVGLLFDGLCVCRCRIVVLVCVVVIVVVLILCGVMGRYGDIDGVWIVLVGV